MNRVDSVLGNAADEVVHAASLLGGRYTLVATNPPYLTRQKMSDELREHLDSHFGRGGDIAAGSRSQPWFGIAIWFGGHGVAAGMACTACVQGAPQGNSHSLPVERYRQVLGSGAFRTISGEVVTTSLSVISATPDSVGDSIAGLDVERREDSR